jgi:hypothetical protein
VIERMPFEEDGIGLDVEFLSDALVEPAVSRSAERGKVSGEGVVGSHLDTQTSQIGKG